MSEATVDRAAWAALIADLIRQETRGRKAEFARKIGVNTVRTVDRWLREEVNVSAESVRKVAQALNLSEVELLTKVGYIRPEHASTAAAAEHAARDQEIIALIESQTSIPPSKRRELIDHYLEESRQQYQMLRRQIEALIDAERRAGGVA